MVSTDNSGDESGGDGLSLGCSLGAPLGRVAFNKKLLVAAVSAAKVKKSGPQRPWLPNQLAPQPPKVLLRSLLKVVSCLDYNNIDFAF